MADDTQAGDTLAGDLRLAVLGLNRCLRNQRLDLNPDNGSESTEHPGPRPSETRLTLSQVSALSTLHLHGSMTPGALAAHERVSRPSMTRTIASLADLGLIDRAPHPTDHRQAILTVSDTGAEFIRTEIHAREAWLDHRLTTLTNEDHRTLRAAVTLLDHLTETPPPPTRLEK